jgi:protein MpaA
MTAVIVAGMGVVAIRVRTRQTCRPGQSRRVPVAVVVIVLLASCATARRPHAERPSPLLPPPPLATSLRTVAPVVAAPAVRIIGRSVRGQPLRAYELGEPSSPRRVLIIGVVHGDEAAGLLIAQELRTSQPTRTRLVIVPDINPDGVHTRTRQNAHGVDLNRNFPWHWAKGGHPGDQQYPGPSPLSEPESHAIALLILRLRPTVTVWFHQPVGVIDQSGGSVAVERRFAQISGEPLRRLTRYPGSAVSWQNALLPASTAFVVELPHTINVTDAVRHRMEAAVHDLAP